MKKTLMLLLFSIICANLRSNAATDSIGFQTVASITKAGHPPVSGLEVFQNQEQLTDYLSEISSDINELSAVPDFNSESCIAIAYAFSNRYYKFQYSITRILQGDTIVVLQHVDSTQLDTTMLIQPGYGVTLITIPETDKPIVTKLESSTGLVNIPVVFRYKVADQPGTLNKVFDIAGRSSHSVSQRRLCISVEAGNGRVKRILRIR